LDKPGLPAPARTENVFPFFRASAAAVAVCLLSALRVGSCGGEATGVVDGRGSEPR
jgi:hypothetical protein